ncbi:MAG TPA: Wzz/FepE/Etk N-terminal domain-containing protein, partial [bacterium]|nr:Wzz/FepE/Etk N-terminal domain-containing protein [bacterium]
MDNGLMKNEIEISLKDIIRIFKRNLKIFFITSGTFFVLALAVYLFFITPVYEVNATAETRANESAPMMSDPMAFLLSTAKAVDTSIDIDLLKSRKVLNKVIESFNLQMKVTRDSNNMFMYFLRKLLGVPDCNAHVFFRQFPDSLKNGKGSITASESGYEIFHEGNTAKCSWGKECVLNSGIIVLEKTGIIPETAGYSFFYEDIYSNRMALMDSTVVFPSETSSLLNLSFIHTSPEMGANILNKLIDSYIEVKKEWMKEDENVKEEYINSVLDRLEKDLEDKGRRMILFQKEKETIIPEI